MKRNLKSNKQNNLIWNENNAENLANIAQVGSTTYTDGLSLTFTPDASSDYYLFYSAVIQNNGTPSEGMSTKLRDVTASVDYNENVITPPTTGQSTTRFPLFTLYRKTLTATSTTWSLQYRISSSSFDAAIAIINTELVQTVDTSRMFSVF